VLILALPWPIENFNGFDSGNLKHFAGLAGVLVAPHLLVVGGKLVGFHQPVVNPVAVRGAVIPENDASLVADGLNQALHVFALFGLNNDVGQPGVVVEVVEFLFQILFQGGVVVNAVDGDAEQVGLLGREVHKVADLLKAALVG